MVVVFSTIVALPLAISLFDPDFNSRSADLLVFNSDRPFYQELHIFVTSFADLFNLKFLFVSGDAIYRHSLPVFGMLGTISVIPFVTVLRTKKYSLMMIYFFLLL